MSKRALPILPVLAVVACICNPQTARALPLTIDFESFDDATPIVAPIGSATFTNATVVSAGLSLNEFEYPPISGSNVVFDDGGPLMIDFSTPIDSFGGFFTYSASITLSAYDSVGNLLASVTSAYVNNLALSGDSGSSPNELLQLVAAGIASIVVTGSPIGGSFTLDDVTLDTALPTTPIPEPTSITLVAGGLAIARALRRRASRSAGIREPAVCSPSRKEATRHAAF